MPNITTNSINNSENGESIGEIIKDAFWVWIHGEWEFPRRILWIFYNLSNFIIMIVDDKSIIILKLVIKCTKRKM